MSYSKPLGYNRELAESLDDSVRQIWPDHARHLNQLRILITNQNLTERAGTQLYVRDLAMALLTQGHQPIIYSPRIGCVGQELRNATIPVIDDLDQLAIKPDIIHGNQHAESMSALLHFRGIPAIYVCHSWSNSCEAPPIFPRILRYVAVDQTCYDRLTALHGIDQDNARIILNFVDLERFKPRPALPERPKRALVISNRAGHMKIVREACARSGIELDAIGLAFGAVSHQPEVELRNYDLIFAKGRSALEALAVGAAVVLCDAMGSGPMVTERDLPYLRRLNFGARSLQAPLAVETVEREIARYDPADAGEVSRIIRATAGRELAVSQIMELYEEVVCTFARNGKPDPDEEGRAAARYIQQLRAEQLSQSSQTPRWKGRLRSLPGVGPGLRSLKRILYLK